MANRALPAHPCARLCQGRGVYHVGVWCHATPQLVSQGIHLALNGKPWYFSGTNAFNLAQYDAYEEEV